MIFVFIGNESALLKMQISNNSVHINSENYLDIHLQSQCRGGESGLMDLPFLNQLFETYMVPACPG